MTREFEQVSWDESLQDDCRQLVRLAIREDLERRFDLTTVALVAQQRQGRAVVVARQAGVVCGLQAAETVLEEMDSTATLTKHVAEGDQVNCGTALATLAGPARDLLTAERLILNLLGRLSGIATLTNTFVQRVANVNVGIYDTRKTTPGWRRLEKFAVRCGGGRNHRTGLFDAVLIKDNHLALVAHDVESKMSPADAVRQARQFLDQQTAIPANTIVEVEVDDLEQLQLVLPLAPDIVLLDNMTLDQLRSAIAMRNQANVPTQLEASGGVNLDTIREIAETGVERISVGALTHSAVSLDVALDWETAVGGRP